MKAMVIDRFGLLEVFHEAEINRPHVKGGYLLVKVHASSVNLIDNLSFLFGNNNHFNNIVLKFENSNEKDKDVKDRLNINMFSFSMEDELKEYLYLINSGIEETMLLVLEHINRRMEYEKRVVEKYSRLMSN